MSIKAGLEISKDSCCSLCTLYILLEVPSLNLSFCSTHYVCCLLPWFPTMTDLSLWNGKTNKHFLLQVYRVTVFYHSNRKATNTGGNYQTWRISRRMVAIKREEIGQWPPSSMRRWTGDSHLPRLQSAVPNSQLRPESAVEGREMTSPSALQMWLYWGKRALTNYFMQFCLKLEELFHAICFFFGMERNIMWKTFTKYLRNVCIFLFLIWCF